VGDPRVREFCESIFDLAGAYLAEMPMLHRTVGLGPATVTIHAPVTTHQSGIEPLDGLRAIMPSPPTADFEIACVDARGPISLPIGTWPSTWHGPLGVVPAHLSAPFRLAMDRHTQTISIFHVGLGRGVVWMWDYSLLPYWAAATPWRLMLAWCADTFDAEMVHAACITQDERAALLVGRSGAGKSTLALQATECGWGLVGDDFILVHRGRAFPVFTRAKAHDATFGLLKSGWTILNGDADGEKRILDISKYVVEQPFDGSRVSAIVVPEQSESASVAPITSGIALLALAPYSLSGLLGGVSRSLLRMRQLVEHVPAFRLSISRDALADLGNLDRLWEFSGA
jgi:hypothetical protein